MSIVVGYHADSYDKDALALAAMLARSSGEGVLVCSVVRRPWPTSLTGREADEQEARAEADLDVARHLLPSDVEARFTVRRARSIPTALLALAEESGADLLVVGSSTDGVFGRIALGSTSNALLHSAGIVVAVAPRGFKYAEDARVCRVSLACGPSYEPGLLHLAAASAARFGASVRLVSFMSRVRPDYTMTMGVEGETGVLDTWVGETREVLDRAMSELAALPTPPALEEPVIGRGPAMDGAIADVDWNLDEILMVGSSSVAPAARVFLGSQATKIVRHSPVPVLVVPRAIADAPGDPA